MSKICESHRMNFYYAIEGQMSIILGILLSIISGIITLLVPAYVIASIVWGVMEFDVEIFNKAMSITFGVMNLLVTVGVILYGIRLFTVVRLMDLKITVRRKSQAHTVFNYLILNLISRAFNLLLLLNVFY